MIKSLMMDVDGVLVCGRPEDGLPWATSLEADLGLNAGALHREFFEVHWEDVVVGRAGLMDRLQPVLEKIAPHLTPDEFIAYWFARDARLDDALMREMAAIRAGGVAVHLATNQEHMRAEYLMGSLGLAERVDGIHYSAELGVRKPGRDFFVRVAAKTGFAARELFLVDDTAENVRAALEAGWKAAQWKTGESLAALFEREGVDYEKHPF